MSSKTSVLLCIVLALDTAGCSLFFDYPESVSETGADACSDGSDNDLDGLVDCDDSANCVGFCPEENAVTCSDGVDNDGDTLLDASDPRCWPAAPPIVQRCASRPEVRFFERFETIAPEERWFASGTVDTAAQQAIVSFESFRFSPGSFLGFHFNTAGERQRGITSLGSATARRVFAGSWHALELSFDAAVPIGSVLRVALVPEVLAPEFAPPQSGPEATLLAVSLDSSIDPPVFALEAGGSRVTAELPNAAVCGNTLCDEGFRRVGLQVVNGVFEVSLAGSDVELTTPVRSEVLPASRLVIWGGSWSPDLFAGIDNIDLRIRNAAPCGFHAPQIPGSSCGVVEKLAELGRSVAVSRKVNGEFCAFVAGTAQSARPALSAWTSEDGQSWQSAAELIELPGVDELIGTSIVHNGERFRAVIAYRESDEVRLAFASNPSCGGLSEFEPRLELPIDAEAPSYVETTHGLEIYFTRPPTDDADRTLWRASGVNEASLVVEPDPIVELTSVAAPVTIQKVGPADLVMTYPRVEVDSAFGVRVAASASGTAWTSVDLSEVSASASLLGFDADTVAAVSLHWEQDTGILLYAGSRNQTVSVGTALLFPSAASPQFSEVGVCGDDDCKAPLESCQTCAVDCECPGLSLLPLPLDPGDWVNELDFDPLTAMGDALVWAGSGAASLELEVPVSGDFELAFDVTFQPVGGFYCAPFNVGLAADLGLDVPAAGIFARFDNACASWRGQPAVEGVPAGGASVDASATCADSELEFEADVTRQFLLRRSGGQVTLTTADAGSCQGVALDYTGALPPLRTLLVGSIPALAENYGGCVSGVSGVSLRLLDNPEACPASERLCSEADGHSYCVDVSESQEHCGSCGARCSAGADCEGGKCVCRTGTACDGECVDLATSGRHCGACNSTCSSYCFLGECDVGETCSAPKPLPSEGGSFRFDLATRTQDVSFCGGLVTESDAVFAWTPSSSGQVIISAAGDALAGTVLGVAMVDTCESPDAWRVCNIDPDELGDPSVTTLSVQGGTTYYIVVGFYFFFGSPEVTLGIEWI